MTQLEIVEKLKELTPTERLEVGKVILELIQQDFQHLKPGPAMSQQKVDPCLEMSAQAMLDLYSDDEEKAQKMLKASAEFALPYYLTDKELTIFTALDGEDFLEDDEPHE